jgi:hypothetical protein
MTARERRAAERGTGHALSSADVRLLVAALRRQVVLELRGATVSAMLTVNATAGGGPEGVADAFAKLAEDGSRLHLLGRLLGDLDYYAALEAVKGGAR